ncbi:MAG: acylphosphatase [Atopobiaceae bacterium]|nr:acylphosphatase [Atopobiaceae bacterium]
MRWPWQRKPKPKPTIPDGAIRRRLLYTGRVQAVGFRFTVEGCAREAGVTGWVRNMEDGSVLVEVQGVSEQVRAFRRLVQDQMDNPRTFIEGRLASEEAVEPKPEDRFSIHNI